MSSSKPSVAVIIPVRNERDRLPGLLQCIEAQTVQPDEVIVADGASTDGSRAWLVEATSTRPWLRWVDNPDIVIPAALNRAVATTTADIVARMDAHAEYAPDYLERIVEVLAAHPEVAGAGGAMQTHGDGRWGRAIATVLRSRWGLGGAPHRVGGTAGPVDHVFCSAYRRNAVVSVGGWDSRLLANEDAELDYRIGTMVGPVWLEPKARSTWATRTSPFALARQMWRYGFYRARTVHLHPASLKPRHLVPVALVAGLSIACIARPKWGARALALYFSVAWSGAAIAGHRSGASAWRAGLALPIVHFAWGSGMLVGLVRHRGAQEAPGLRTLAPASVESSAVQLVEEGF